MGERDGGGQSGGAEGEGGGIGNGAPPSLDQVVAAIHAMHSMQATERDNANTWLRYLQKSVSIAAFHQTSEFVIFSLTDSRSTLILAHRRIRKLRLYQLTNL